MRWFFWSVFLLTLIFSECLKAEDRTTILVGASSVDITPKTPVMMGGYASRSKPHEGVRSPIFTRALYIEDDVQGKLLWTESDLIGFEPEDVIEIQKILSEKTGVPTERIVISATHNHSGPATAEICSPKETEYLYQTLIPCMLQASEQAIETAEKCQMIVVEGHSELTHDRRNDPVPGDGAAPNPDKAKAVVDYRVPAVAFKRLDGSMKALLLLYAMHPTSWGDQLIGSEWPGSTANAVRETFGETTEPFIVQGAAGNLGSPCRQADPEEMKRWGRELVASVADLIRSAEPLQKPRFAVRTTHIQIEYERFSADEIHQQADNMRAQFANRPDLIQYTFDPWEQNTRNHLENGTGYFVNAPITAIAFGNHVFVTTPFETFSHLNVFIAKKVDFPVHVVGYTNGVLNYFPSIDAIEQGGYEPQAYIWYRRFPMKSGALEKLAEDLVPLLTETFSASKQ